MPCRPLERLPREIRATALVDRGDVERGLTLFRELLPGADVAKRLRAATEEAGRLPA